MKRILAVLLVGAFLAAVPGIFAAEELDNYGFLKLKVTKVGVPLASYPVSIKQVIPARLTEDQATHTIHLRRTTNANGRVTFKDKIHLKRPFILEVGIPEHEDMEYFVTRRQIQTFKDSGASDMLVHVNFPAEAATFRMTKLGEDDCCRITCVLKNCKAKGLKFFLNTQVGDKSIKVVDKGNVFDFTLPAPDKDDQEAIDYTLVLKEGTKVLRKFQFTVKPGEVRKDLTIDFGSAKDASE